MPPFWKRYIQETLYLIVFAQNRQLLGNFSKKQDQSLREAEAVSSLPEFLYYLIHVHQNVLFIWSTLKFDRPTTA